MGQEELGESNVHEEPRDLVILSHIQGKKRIVIDTPTLKGAFRENSMLFDFSPKSTMHVPKLLPQKDSLSSPSQSDSFLSIGGILEVRAEC